MAGSRAAAQGLLLAAAAAALTACRQAPPAEPTAEESARSIAVALAGGQIELADRLRERLRQRHPDDALGLRWSAVVSQLLWQDDRAAAELDMLRRTRDRGGLDPAEANGLLGDTLFLAGRWGESVAPLQAAYTGPEGLRRVAFAMAARQLPFRRMQAGPLATEQPLLAGAPPEFLCGTGRVRRPFAIDTGTSMTTLSRSLAADLGVRVLTGAGTARDGAGRELPVEIGILEGFAVGEVDLGAVPVLVIDDARLELRDELGGAERSPGGVLGLGLIALFRLTLDPDRRSVALERPRGLGQAESVQCVRADGRCLVPVVIDGQGLWFVLDTGASHSSLTEAGLRAIPDGPARAGTGFRRIHTVAGRSTSVREVRELTLRVSQTRFRGLTLPVVPREADGLFPVHGVIGGDLLLQCRVTLDRGRVRIEAIR